MNRNNFATALVVCMLISFCLFSQNLYTARGYWEELTKATYREIKLKEAGGTVLTNDERSYVNDYEAYLFSYYQKLSQGEQEKFAEMKAQWDAELDSPAQVTEKPLPQTDEFEWRSRDKMVNALYGVYYGLTFAAIAEIDNAAAVGIPLITGGLWLLGPAINKEKYEGITQTTIRAGNTGKLMGLGYGLSLGLAIAGDNSDGKLALFLSSAGSIALGEIGFQTQKRNDISEGRVEMFRHYGFLGPWVAVAGNIALTNEQSTRSIGVTLLTGGVAGMAIGNRVGKRYAYTGGDVQVISSLSLVSTGLGFAAVAEAIDENNSNALILLPAAGSIAGTILGQRMIKGVYLTRRQGSFVNLAAGGSALISLGILTLVEPSSLTAWIAVPSVAGLVAHQIAFRSLKKENLLKGVQGSRMKRNNWRLSMNLAPENYFINQRMVNHETRFSRNAPVSNPIVKIKLSM